MNFNQPGVLHRKMRFLRGVCTFPFILLFLYASAAASPAHEIRPSVTLSTARVFERMLASARDGDYEKIDKAMALLDPLVVYLDQTFALSIKEEVRAAITKDDPKRLSAAVQRLVALSVRDLLQQAHTTSSRSDIISNVKVAYTEYLILDRYVRKTDFEMSKTLKTSFRLCNSMAGVDDTQFMSNCEGIVAALDDLFIDKKDLVGGQ